jgi:aminoglycoside phosphotransferase (APT) family kinase protein
MSPLRDDVAVYLSQIPDLERFDKGQLSIVELGGTTNRNFRVATPAGQFALRLPARDRAGFVNRGWEVRSARLAANAGIGAPLIYADAATGVMLTRWIEGVPLTAAAVRNDPALPRRVAALLKTLHQSKIRFPRPSTRSRSFRTIGERWLSAEASRCAGRSSFPKLWEGRATRFGDRRSLMCPAIAIRFLTTSSTPASGSFWSTGNMPA